MHTKCKFSYIIMDLFEYFPSVWEKLEVWGFFFGNPKWAVFQIPFHSAQDSLFQQF